MIQHLEVSDIELRKLIKEQQICFGGNEKLKIYGDLKCKSGKRMKKENRVFFVSKDDPIQQGVPPLRTLYEASLLAMERRTKVTSTLKMNYHTCHGSIHYRHHR